jgi:hypothetical protein
MEREIEEVEHFSSANEDEEALLERSHPQPPGRPKGTTAADYRAKDKNKEILLEAITVDYTAKKGVAGSRKLPKGTLDAIIQQQKQEHSMAEKNIPVETIRSRWKKRHITDVKIRRRSPLEKIDPLIVQAVTLVAVQTDA